MAGKSGTLKSLQVFLAEKKRSFGVRINADLPSVLDTRTVVQGYADWPYRLLSIPFYLTGQLPQLCREYLP